MIVHKHLQTATIKSHAIYLALIAGLQIYDIDHMQSAYRRDKLGFIAQWPE